MPFELLPEKLQSVKLWTILLLLFITSSVCNARLGETMDQCVARFGQGTSVASAPGLPGKDSVAFQQNGIIMIVAFMNNGKAGMELLAKKNGDDFFEAEVLAFLNAEAGGQKWQSVENPKGKVWMRDDGATAFYDPTARHITFMSAEYFEATEAMKASDAKGF